jgi:hypothetical protein
MISSWPIGTMHEGAVKGALSGMKRWGLSASVSPCELVDSIHTYQLLTQQVSLALVYLLGKKATQNFKAAFFIHPAADEEFLALQDAHRSSPL